MRGILHNCGYFKLLSRHEHIFRLFDLLRSDAALGNLRENILRVPQQLILLLCALLGFASRTLIFNTVVQTSAHLASIVRRTIFTSCRCYDRLYILLSRRCHHRSCSCMPLGRYSHLTVIYIISNRQSVVILIAFLSFSLHLQSNLLVLLLLQESLIQAVN